MARSVDVVEQRAYAVKIVRELRAAGFEACWAGGCVRDELLGRQPDDYDIATSATPKQIRKLFGHKRTLAVGAAFGVIVVLAERRSAGQFDVATFRSDGKYSDGRHPDDVSFGTAEEDAARRDFTINGMFYDPVAEELIDYVGGKADLEAGLIRAIGDPEERFAEDKLRMLRAVRFAARFDFEIERATRNAVEKHVVEINVVSPERIAKEMEQLLLYPRRTKGLELLRLLGLLRVLLPEVADRAAESHPAWQHTLNVLNALEEPTFPLTLAALLHGVRPDPAEAAEVAEGITRRWRLSNHDIDRVSWLVAQQRALDDGERQPWSRLQPVLIEPGSGELIALVKALREVAKHNLDDIEFCRDRLRLPDEELNPPPLLSGGDLIEHGIARGPIFKVLLEKVRDAQLDGQVESKEEALAFVDKLVS